MTTTETAPETKGQTETQTAEPKKTRSARAARVTGGAKPTKLRLTSRAKSPKANGSEQTKAKAQKKAPAQKGGTPVQAKNDFTNDQVLTAIKPPEAAFLLGRYKLLKSGMTVKQALAVFTEQKPKLRRRRQSLRSLIAGGFISVR